MDTHPTMQTLLDQFEGDAWKMYKATGIMLPIAGGADGYNETADVLTRTVDGVPFEQLYAEIVDALALINANRSPLIERLTFPVTSPFEEIMPITEEDFEEADEYAQPVGIRLGRPWNMGFDMRYYDLGIRYTFRFLGRARSGQIRALLATAVEADRRLIATKILQQLFQNTNKAATLEDTGTAVTVYPLYNGDVTALPVAPPAWKSYSHTTTHTHFLASGAATANSGDLDEMFDHIYHHGHVEGAELLLFVNRQEAKIIRKFKVPTDDYDFIPAVGVPGSTFLGTMVGTLASPPSDGLATFPGFIGNYGPWSVIQEDYIPAGYMVGLASGGKYSIRNPIGLREHENEQLRGLKIIPQFERYPLRESFYHHALGTGVRYPGSGVVMKVTASTYTVPSVSISGPGGR